MEYVYEAISSLNPNIESNPRLKRMTRRGSSNYLIIGRSEEEAVRQLDYFCHQLHKTNRNFKRISRTILASSEKLIAEVK